MVYLIRYPDLDTRLSANNVTANSNAITTDNVTRYHLQKLQEVGYRDIEIVNNTSTTVNLTNPQTNETISTVLAKLVKMAYSTAIALNEISRGYFLSTSTNATVPNPRITKGYGVFYEGNANNTSPAATLGVTTIPASSGLQPLLLPPSVAHMFDSFELIAASEVAQVLALQGAAVGQTEGGGEEGGAPCDSSYPDTCIPPPPPDLNCDDDGVPENFEVVGSDPPRFNGDTGGIGCESGSGAPDGSDDDEDRGDDDDNGAGEEPDPGDDDEGDGGGEPT